MENLPVVGGFGAVALVIAFRLLSERNEIVDLRKDVKTLAEKLAVLESKYDEERRLKHAALNELTKAQVLLGLIIDLAEKCTCGALNLVHDLLARSVNRSPE